MNSTFRSISSSSTAKADVSGIKQEGRNSKFIFKAPAVTPVALAAMFSVANFVAPMDASAAEVCVNGTALNGNCQWPTSGGTSYFPHFNTSDYAVIGNSGGNVGSAAMFSGGAVDWAVATARMQFTAASDGNVLIHGVTKGIGDNDAVNISQLKGVTTALGGGAAVSATDGSITQPSYALTNANSINGTSGAATDVGTAFGTVDAALGKLNSNVTQNTLRI